VNATAAHALDTFFIGTNSLLCAPETVRDPANDFKLDFTETSD